MKEFMSEEARRYYAGGRRVMQGGVPCRVANHGPIKGKAFIKAAVAGQVEIDGDNGLAELAAFRFIPANGAREDNRKPAKRAGYSYKPRFKSISGWTPAGLSYHPYEARELTDTPAALESAKRDYHKGNPKPLREYLAATAGERRAYWAAYDAAQFAETVASYRLAA